MPFSRAVDDAILGVFRGTTYTAPSAVYVALFTTAPAANDGTSAVEVSTGTWTNYARTSLGTLSAAWNAISGTSTRSMTNASAVSFGTATISGSAPTVVAFGFYDASTSGNFLGYGSLTTSKIITDSDVVQFAAGALTMSEA